jgi:L-fuculose-phosphate aldolase
MEVWEARQEIVTYSHKVQKYGYVSATDGNLSIRLDERHVLITPSGLEKGEMTVEDPIIVDMEGNKVEGKGKPSSEGKLHLEVYHARPDIDAVIHAHPPVSIAFTVAGLPVDTCLLPEVVVTMGAVPTSSYATPTTEEVPQSIRHLILESDAVMLARHGSLTIGKNLKSAFKILEKIEHSAQIAMYARMLGGPVPFSREELDKLYALRRPWGVEKELPDCTDAGSCSVQQKSPLSAAAAPTGTCALYGNMAASVHNASPAGNGGLNGGGNKMKDLDFETPAEDIARKVREELSKQR